MLDVKHSEAWNAEAITPVDYRYDRATNLYLRSVDGRRQIDPADGRRVTQMLYNLLSNAIGFSEDGGKIALTLFRDKLSEFF